MDRQRVKFTFEDDLVKEPIIYRLGQDFHIVTNIRRADVREQVGWVVLELDGEKEEIIGAPEAAAQLGRKARKPWDMI